MVDSVPPSPLNRGNRDKKKEIVLAPSVKRAGGVQTNFEHGGFRYSNSIGEAAKSLRKNPTEAEKKLWDCLLRSKQTGYKFTRQKPIDKFILDFYCSELLLCIEVDGKYHEKFEEQDEARTEKLNSLGIQVIRYTNEQILEEFVFVKLDLMNKLVKRFESFNFDKS